MKYFHELQEGVYDPNIFKAFFLAGGPGSGKSFVVRKTTGGTGLKIVNSDPAFELLIKKASLSLKMPESEFDRREPLRKHAGKLAKKKKGNYVEGRLGLIIDGTGHDADRLLDQAGQLEELGYDTHMIFVNTSLDVALQRNTQRARSVPESIVVKSWKDVQANIGRFNNFFKGRMIIVDNNDTNDNPFTEVWKRVQGLLRKKVTNTRATNWIAMELAKKKR
jgi:cytidylate kinase